MGIKAVILLGAPGAGKGTIAEAVAAVTEYKHFSTGDMLRDAVKQGTELGQAANVYMNQGSLVPDEMVVRMVVEHLRQGSADARYMFDGFPRTPAQAELLDKHFKHIQAVLSSVCLLEVTREIVLELLTGRRVCRKCGAIFHVRNVPPKKEGVCDACGGELIQRPDDMPETILNRLDVFQRQTEDLIAYYDQKHLLIRIASSCQKDETVARVLAVLAKPSSGGTSRVSGPL